MVVIGFLYFIVVGDGYYYFMGIIYYYYRLGLEGGVGKIKGVGYVVGFYYYFS